MYYRWRQSWDILKPLPVNLHLNKKIYSSLDLHAPADFSIVGFDDIDLAEHLAPPLTTMRVHKEAMGAVAVQTLIARVNNSEAIHMNHILDVHLVIRDSVQTLTY